MNCKYSVYHIKSRNYLIILEKLIFKMSSKKYSFVFESQKNFFESKATLDISYRINSLKKLKKHLALLPGGTLMIVSQMIKMSLQKH